MSSTVPSPHELAGESGRTPAVTTRRIDVLTQRCTKLESALKQLQDQYEILLKHSADRDERLAEVEQRDRESETLWQFISDLQGRVQVLETQPTRAVSEGIRDKLYRDIKAFMQIHPGLQMNTAMITANMGVPVKKNHLATTRLEALVKEGVLRSEKIVGRERTYWLAETDKK